MCVDLSPIIRVVWEGKRFIFSWKMGFLGERSGRQGEREAVQNDIGCMVIHRLPDDKAHIPSRADEAIVEGDLEGDGFTGLFNSQLSGANLAAAVGDQSKVTGRSVTGVMVPCTVNWPPLREALGSGELISSH